jgi:hypothetical protein
MDKIEWCADLFDWGPFINNRRLRGGGWMDDNAGTVVVLFRDGINGVNANSPGGRVGQHQACGFRLARNAED